MFSSKKIKIELKKLFDTRYGENPHQRGAFFTDSKNKDQLAIQNFKKLQGKEISFNNLLDINAAIEVLSEIDKGKPSCVVIKHGNPCGAAYGKDIKEAFSRAWYKGDSLAAFGGIIGVNRIIKEQLAKLIIKNFFEVLIAPEITKSALQIFTQKPKSVVMVNLSLKNPYPVKEAEMKKIRGGFLVQEPDFKKITKENFKVVTKMKPTKKQTKDLFFAWKVCKTSKSNAIVLVKEETLISSGVGQQDRKRCCKLAVQKAGKASKNSVAASDGFFPFPDGPRILIRAGVKGIIQPGGSIRDKETIDLCNRYKIPMVFTGIRCFKH